MRIVTLKNISRKDMTIHYRREFSGQAVLELFDGTPVEKRLEFVLEHNPTGKVDIRVSLLDDVDYPLLPIIQSLKSFITDLDKKGQLP